MNVRTCEADLPARRRATAISIALAVFVFGVFGRTLTAGFLGWDDGVNVFENPHVQELTAENLRWMFTDFEQAIRYKPLSWLAWALVHELFGLKPFGYHLANVLLHCANTLLVFLLLRRLLHLSASVGSRQEEVQSEMWMESPRHLMPSSTMDACAALGTLLWAVHPLRVEPVAWVTGMPYGLAVLFLLMATLFYLRAHAPEAERAGRRRDYWLSVAAFALAALSYPIVLGFVVALVALDFYPLRRLGGGAETGIATDHWRAVLLDKLPFLALSLLLVAVTVYGRFHFTGTWDKPATLENFPLLARAMQVFYVWAYYVWKPLLPLDLCPVYTVLVDRRFTEWPFLLSALGVLASCILLWARRHAWPAAAALWLAHLGLLVPMLGLTEHPHYPNDRYGIINGILWAVAAAGLFWRWSRVVARPMAMAVAGVTIVSLMAGMSWHQTAIWQSDLTFFKDMAVRVRHPQHRAQALAKLGKAHSDTANDASAVACYHEALRIYPTAATFLLHYNLGNAYARQAQWGGAIAAYEAALRLESNADAHHNLGVALTVQGELDRAAEHFAQALRLNPQNIAAHTQLARVFARQGKVELARQHAAEVERLKRFLAP